MNARAKSLILLLATLLIGIVLGALLHARVADERIEQLAYLRSSPGFIRYMERAIEPTDAAQQEAVRAILRDAARQLADQRVRTQAETRSIMDSMRADLEQVLTDEQKQQLRQRLNRERQRRFEQRSRPPERERPPRRRRDQQRGT